MTDSAALESNMVDIGVWTVTAVCMTVSLLISFWGANRYRLKFVSFLIASVVGMLLFSLICGVWIAEFPQEEDSIATALRSQIWSVIGGIVVMAYFGAWRLRAGIDETNTRRKT